MPIHPERVISRAVKAGLSATIELQRNINNKTTNKYYKRSRERFDIRQQVYQLTKERGKADFSYICMAEAPTRTDARQMFYESAAKYGFTEARRQKKSDDTVNPLNQRFNVCGAVVRENSEVDFPFPTPVDLGTHTRSDGKGRKKFRRAGYERTSFGPKVILAHPDLPSLDFGDAVRTHNEYLATFCAIHDVPIGETTRYSQLFYLLVRPYLEYLYSEFKCGKRNFQKGVNWALCQVKELILKNGYRPTMYEKQTVTEELEFNGDIIEEENRAFFKKKEDEAREFYGDHPVITELKRLRGNLGEDEEKKGTEAPRDKDDSILTEKDAIHLRNEVAKRARIAGSIIHRRLAALFPSPWHLNDIILSGDRYTRSSEYIILAEVPLQTASGAGKIDLLLCKRTISKDGKTIFWKPVLILEIKTRLGQSVYIDANYKESEVRPEGSSLQRIVSEFLLSDYALTDDLWDTIVLSTPTHTARTQLNIYCEALEEQYKAIAEQELGHILRGVLVIEASSDISEIRTILQRLIIHGYERLKHRGGRIERTVFTPPKSDSYRIALVIDEQLGPRRENDESAQAPWGPAYTPFKAKKTKRKFLLYLAGHSPTSAGQSAAWNARYYHGLQMLFEMKHVQQDCECAWIDLASQFDQPQLAEARLRLRPQGYSEEQVAKVQPDHIREFFERIDVRGYLDDTLSFLYRNRSEPSFELKLSENKRKVIIVTGADALQNATPLSHREQLSILIDHLLGSLPDDEMTTVVWFDTPVPSIEKAIPYSSRALLPYYETSSLREVVTEILWNMPIAPRSAIHPEKWGLSIIGDAPMHDDIRTIIRHNPTNLQAELTHVPLLKGWSKRFKNQGMGRVVPEREIDDVIPEKTVRNRVKMATMALLPWLVRLWPSMTLVGDSKKPLEEQISRLEERYRGGTDPLKISETVLTETPCKPPSLLDLVKFRLPKTVDAKSYQNLTISKVNSQRLYRSSPKLQTQPFQDASRSLPTQDIIGIDEEIARDWVFGVKFESEDEDIRSWWMVVQDPEHPSRMLVGCFTDRPPDKDGFVWTENKREILTQLNLDEILGSPQTLLIGMKNESGMEIWSVIDCETPVHTGALELRGQGRSTTSHLRAIRQTVTEEPPDGPSVSTRPSESFHKRVIEALKTHLASVASPTPVSVGLEMVDDSCHVLLRDDEGNTIQDITIDYTADLISFLRWPMAKGGPMFTDSGEYVTWSIFDDIDYGELDFISPYVTYTASRRVPAELPKRVSQFFDGSDSLAVNISHDASICPIALDQGVDHETCWRIELPPNCPRSVRKQLGRAFTGAEVNGLLAPGKLFAGRLYTLDFILPMLSEKDESIVFHEERYIRMLLRQHDVHLKKLSPGTFLHATGQQWKVSIEWDDRHFKWQARSQLTGLFFSGGNQTVKLIHGHGAQEECDRLLNIITSKIPPAQIHEYSELEQHVLLGLKNRGYSKKSPACELRFIEQSDDVCRYGIFLSESSQRTPLESFSIEAGYPSDPEVVLEVIAAGLTEGTMSVYNVRNVEEFMEQLSLWVNEHVLEAEWESEGPVEYEVTITLDDSMQSILWEAKSDRHKSGVLYDDLKILLHAGLREAIHQVREIFKLDVIPQLGVVSNLEDVLKKQIPEMVRSLRERRNSGH